MNTFEKLAKKLVLHEKITNYIINEINNNLSESDKLNCLILQIKYKRL